MTFPTWPARPTRPGDQRGAVLPSPVVLLSVVAVVLAVVAFVATRGDKPAERDISATTAASTPTPSDDAASGSPSGSPSSSPSEKPKPKPVDRSKQPVVVFNNTAIKGLAGRVSEKVKEAGWTVAAADNWYGTVPASTVYYPQGKKAAAQLLALDLGIARIKPADTGSDMSDKNLTLILTGELD